MQTQPDTHSSACGVVTHCRLHSACMDFIPVYQPSTRSTAGKPCAPRLSGGFLFAVLGVGLPDVYQGDFLREKPPGSSLFFCLFSTFRSMQGALCCHSWLKIPFSSSLRYFLPCFGRELSSAPEFKRRNSNEKPEACSQPGSHRGHDFRPDGDGLQRREQQLHGCGRHR